MEHARVYFLADAYFLADLKELSLLKFQSKIAALWASEELADCITCNDRRGHSLHMREGPGVLALPRCRAYTGHVTDARPSREERALRDSRISLVSHMSCILTSLLGI